jgi:hypothetical protein
VPPPPPQSLHTSTLVPPPPPPHRAPPFVAPSHISISARFGPCLRRTGGASTSSASVPRAQAPAPPLASSIHTVLESPRGRLVVPPYPARCHAPLTLSSLEPPAVVVQSDPPRRVHVHTTPQPGLHRLRTCRATLASASAAVVAGRRDVQCVCVVSVCVVCAWVCEWACVGHVCEFCMCFFLKLRCVYSVYICMVCGYACVCMMCAVYVYKN